MNAAAFAWIIDASGEIGFFSESGCLALCPVYAGKGLARRVNGLLSHDQYGLRNIDQSSQWGSDDVRSDARDIYGFFLRFVEQPSESFTGLGSLFLRTTHR